MKEERYFYCPDLPSPDRCRGLEGVLPDSEESHALRVLRLTVGEPLMLMDGRGTFFQAVVVSTSGHHLHYRIDDVLPQQSEWPGHLHLAVAPTKMMERTEWLIEKAVEIGINELSLLDCRFSERRQVKSERLERIVVAAVKQSRKAWMPRISPMTPLQDFLRQNTTGHRFIAHCYEEVPRQDLFTLLMNITSGSDKHLADGHFLVLVGPEGDFSIDEVKLAISLGYQSVSLGSSRLRTETAGLMAAMQMRVSVSR